MDCTYKYNLSQNAACNLKESYIQINLNSTLHSTAVQVQSLFKLVLHSVVVNATWKIQESCPSVSTPTKSRGTKKTERNKKHEEMFPHSGTTLHYVNESFSNYILAS